MEIVLKISSPESGKAVSCSHVKTALFRVKGKIQFKVEKLPVFNVTSTMHQGMYIKK